MASAFKAIGKFIFGGGGSGTQPAGSSGSACPAQNPSGTPNTNKPTAQPTFLSSAAAAPAAGAVAGGRPCSGVNPWPSLYLSPKLPRSASFRPMPDPQWAMMAAAMMHENGRLVNPRTRL